MNILANRAAGDFYRHNASEVNYPLNAPDDLVSGINRDDSYLDQTILNTSLYRLCMNPSVIKPMQYNKGIERAIARLIAPDCLSGLNGYVAYGFDVNGNFFADYWDGTADDFNEGISAGETDYSKYNRQLFKIDDKGKMYACVIDEDGDRSKLTLDTKANAYSKVKKHSPSGVIFALAAYIISRIKTGRMESSDPGTDVANIINDHYEGVVSNINSGNIEKAAAYLRCLDNDLYTLCRFDNEVKTRYDSIPFVSGQVDRNEYPLLTETEFEMEVVFGHSAILSGSVCLSDEGGYVDEDDVPNKRTIEDIIGDPTWSDKYELDPERELTPEEELMVPQKDGMVPPRQILTKAELIKASTDLPRPYRNILITGETGSGKSTSAALMAQLFNLPYTFLTINPDTILSDLYVNILPATGTDQDNLEDLTAALPSATDMTLDPVTSYYQISGEHKNDATEDDCLKAIQKRYYDLFNKSGNGFIKVESPLVQAFRNGWVCEIQEVNVANKPGVLSGINAALDDLATIQLPDGEVVKRHPDCVIVMTANVDYEGTRRINQAVKSRCALKGRLNLPDDSALIEMIKLDSGYDDDLTILNMVKAMKGIRKVLNETGTTDGSCGVREIVAWAQATKILNDPYRAAMHTIIPSATEDDEVLAEVIAALENFFVKKTGSKGIEF
ncbi:MAG: AAA family ATPase [Oscillospiraceae bacterium]|nr:AAA family ATPase [Oscillospiraceae bacterium]